MGGEMLAEYGDGVWHRYGWWLASKTSVPFASCRANRGATPEHVVLEHQAADGAALCPWCMDGARSPAQAWVVRPPRRRKRTYRIRASRIRNRPLREAFERSGLTTAELAVRLDWMSRGRPDTARVRRSLGIAGGHRDVDGRMRRQRSIERENASAIVEAIGIAPMDVGL